MTEFRSSRILVVDDDPVSRELLGLLLAREGFGVDQAESGDAALEILKQRELRPDAVLADLQMPGITGRGLAAGIRSICRESIRVIAMSGSGADEEMLEGFDGFLRKPFTMDALKRALADDRAAPSEERSQLENRTFLNQETYEHLSASMGRKKLSELYALCLDDCRRRTVAIRDSAEKGDDAECRKQAHAIKGGCNMVGAMEMGALAEFIENHGLVTSVMGMLDELLLACNRLESILSERKSAPESRAVEETERRRDA